MLNQVIIAGRLTHITDTKVTVAVPRAYKNADGKYENDFIPVKIFGGIADNIKHYCRKGDLVGIKGRLEVEHGKMMLCAEKVSFLSSGKHEEE